jgi:hypothetical protein
MWGVSPSTSSRKTPLLPMQPTVTHRGTNVTESREHLLGGDNNNGNDSDAYSGSLSDKENDNSTIQEELEEERRLKSRYQQSLYNANKRICSAQ